MGATTVWERWDSMLPDGTHQPRRDDLVQPLRARGGGGLAAPDGRRVWLRRRPATGGFVVQPRPTHRLTQRAARHLTPYGDAEVGWERAGGQLLLRVVVPVGATAVVHVPGDEEPIEVGHGRHEWRRSDVLGF